VTITIFWVLAVLLLAQSLAALFLTFGFLRYFRRSRSRPLGNFTPPVALLIPCKGLDPEFETNVERYLGQDYPHYQVIFVVASVDDPAYPVLRSCLEAASKNKMSKEVEAIGPQAPPPHPGIPRETQPGGVRTALLVAGYSDSHSGKIHNLLEGLKSVEAGAEVLAFADSDARLKRDWLRCLVAPLQDPSVTVSTGWQWYLPGSGFTSRLRAAWDALDVRVLGEHDDTGAWGGSMAIRAADFKRLGVAERFWANSFSEDGTLTRAVRETGGRLRFEPRCVLACRGELKFGDFLRWSNRLAVIIRVYSPVVWWAEATAYASSCGTYIWGLILLALPGLSAGQRLLIAGTLLAITLLVLWKGFVHETIAKEVFPEEAPLLSRYGACYWQLSLLAPLVETFNYLRSCLTRRVEWRGTYYELKSRHETRVLRREK
jgi:cellulose synthase/poly-beta-1,6-N-acetylglucosamine synthase-like glycosyltransferase